jgi:hypothetical protein
VSAKPAGDGSRGRRGRWHHVGISQQTALACRCAVSLVAWAAQGRADPVFALGSTFSVSGTNFPTDFAATTATLGTPTTINGLQVSETITPASATQSWMVFSFTNSSGPVIGNPALNFSMDIAGVQTTGPAILSSPFAFFTHDGTPFGPLTAGSGFGVEPIRLPQSDRCSTSSALRQARRQPRLG